MQTSHDGKKIQISHPKISVAGLGLGFHCGVAALEMSIGLAS